MDHTDPATYRFDEYLARLGENWLHEDPLLERWLARSSVGPDARALVERFGRAAATRYREVAEVVERRENLPRIAERGPYNRDLQEIVLPPETRAVLSDVHGSGIWKAALDERVRYAVVYLLNQNGEFGVTCSTACTDGMARVLRAHGDDARSRDVISQLEAATPESYVHGAQFVTEIQGGSDAALNALEAVPVDDGLYELTGQKWFCSNLTADYWMVTARLPDAPSDHRGVGLFCVPRLRDGEPNGHRIDRLKDKLGTRALPTAEVRFEGARGWPVGPLDAGLKNMVAIVLTTSRIHNVIAAAGGVRRACREAHAYAGFRRAFGKRLEEQPLLAASLERVAGAADLLEAGAFGTIDAWTDAAANPDDRERALWVRVLISVAKAISTRRAPSTVYEAMMVFGGNGIEERFCAMPRLWRDAAIMETWEGPYTLLLMQALGDMAKYRVAGREEAFLRGGLGDHLRGEHVEALAGILSAPAEEANVRRWGELAPALWDSFQAKALAELG